MSEKVVNLTIDLAREAIASGKTTATALAELHYDRIASLDGKINSFLALSRARAMTHNDPVHEMDDVLRYGVRRARHSAPA